MNIDLKDGDFNDGELKDCDLKDWIGRSESARDIITATPYAALSATLDHPAERPADGTPLPPVWHWLYFLPLYRQSETGPDGHAKRGGFLPPVALPRRMWAGSELTFHAPLRIGDRVVRKSTIDDVRDKTGKAGPLVFVRVRHEVFRNEENDPALTEYHNIVYREAPRPGAPAATPTPAPAHAPWSRRIVPDDVLLFRYSALTFNGHRIHYDRQYVTQVEGYPGLIVHGPLIATLLLDLLRRQWPDAEIEHFEFRALRPIFDIHPFSVCGEPGDREDETRVHLWATDHEGWLAVDASARLRRPCK